MEFRIRKARLRAIRPYRRPPFQDATMGPFHHFSFASLWLQDEDGHEGESLFFLSQLPILEHHFLPILFHTSDCRYEALYQTMYWSIRNEGYRGAAATALGQLDWALYNLAAARAGQPLHRFLGAERDYARAYASGGGVNYPISELESEMARFADEGYRAVKMKVGMDFGGAMADDVRRVAAVRRVIGDEVALALDANQVWTTAQALEFAKRVSSYNISWLEEPVHSADLYAIKELCASSPVPISFGESEKTDRVFAVLADFGVKHLQPIAGYLASIQEWMNVRNLALGRGLVFSSGGYSQATAQLVATCPENTLTEYLEANNGTMNPYFSLKPALRDGRFLLPHEPGGSIRVDWEYICKKGMLALDKCWDKNQAGPLVPAVM
ncbi:MAG: hypothetical protein J5I98_22405 [Phaeodactylibacter sp.]|nr:hypothetical protein [Phaeodactylibacter sp.]